MTPTEQDLRAFLDWLASEQRTDSAARAARRLAQLSLEELANGRSPAKYPRVALRDAGREVASMTASEQAKADIRTTALHKFFTGNRRQIESWIVANRLQGIVALQLRDHQPAQGAGGEKVFWLERAAVPTVDPAPTPTPEIDLGANVRESAPSSEQHLIDYQMTYCSGPDLSVWGRFIFRDGRLRRGHWRWKLLAGRVLVSVFGAGAAVVIALLTALTAKAGDIALKLALEAAIFAVFLYFKARAWHRTIEDRLRSAPDELVSPSNPTQLEIVGVGPQAEWRIVRYTGTCTVCSGEVQVRPGEPDFPRRMVGRCTQSPREHVFSFDRITLIGGPLIVPPTRRIKEAGEDSAGLGGQPKPPAAAS